MNIFEHVNTKEFTTSPTRVSYFQEVGCLDFCEKLQRVKSHPELTRIFILNLHNHQVHLVGVNFELSTHTISMATRIPCMGEKWFKHVNLDLRHYHPFFKPRYQAHCKTIFPFAHLLERYAPLMKVIIKYFTCEGRFSRLYSYHIRLLMHFTKAKMLQLPYYLYISIDKMSYIVQKRHPSQQIQIIFHHSLINMIVLH